MPNRGTWESFTVLLFLAVLPTIFYYPALFNGMTQVHAETVTFGLPLMDLLWSSIHGESSVLWTNSMYGGHPIFAEGQGGFAHPLNLLVASLFPPIPAYNIFHWLCLMISGLGTYLFCRSFSCSRVSSMFSVVALIFSTLWLLGRSVYPVGGAIVWVPWALCAMNLWLQNADLKSGAYFGLAMSLMLLAGYPQVVHGTVIYIAIYLLVSFGFTEVRQLWLQSLGARLLSGFFAVIVCAGLSAVQLIPLFELVSESHRNEGVELAEIGRISPEAFFRGFLFTINDPYAPYAMDSNSSEAHFPVFGSLIVCVIGSLIVFTKRSSERIATISAVAFLMVLGFGATTPVFHLIYNSHLIPGLHSFRIMWPFMFVGTVGVAILCAIALDDLRSKLNNSIGISPWHLVFQNRLVLAVWTGAWVSAIWLLHSQHVSWLNYVPASLGIIGFIAIMHYRRGDLIPILALVLICLDLFLLRIGSFDFKHAHLLDKPQTVVEIKKINPRDDFKIFHNTRIIQYLLLPSAHPNTEKGSRTILASMYPPSSSLWDISSISGGSALQSQRFSLAWPTILQEVSGEHKAPPGLRLIDFLSLKFVLGKNMSEKTAFYTRYVDKELGVHVVENPYARSKFQVFHDAVTVDNVEQALRVLSTIEKPVLVLEADNIEGLIQQTKGGLEEGFEFEIVENKAGSFEFRISADEPAWLFIADANYPGWNAYLNEEKVSLFSAQILGKAVFIPQGRHSLRVTFESKSFQLGLLISAISLVTLFSVLCYCRLRKFP